LFALRHLAHTFMRLTVPLTRARTRCTFGFQRRRERRCECEMLFPKPGVFPQTSQTEAIRRKRIPAFFAPSESARRAKVACAGFRLTRVEA